MRIPRSELFPGAIYHLTQRGIARRPVFEDANDRRCFLWQLGRVVRRVGWRVYAYCLMENHVHLVLRDPGARLSDGARLLFGGFARLHNERHRRAGHLFQGRYRPRPVADDRDLLEVMRYVLLNPVKAGLVPDPAQWEWSSFAATAGERRAPEWFDVRVALEPFEGSHREFAYFVRRGRRP